MPRSQAAALAPARSLSRRSHQAVRSGLCFFAASVYAERATLLDRVIEATARLEAYRRFHFDTCRATAAALRQVYPAGLQWLDEPR